MRPFLPLLLFSSYVFYACQAKPSPLALDPSKFIPPTKQEIAFSDIIREAAEYVDSANLETRFCFLFDADAPSSSSRFIVYDLENDSIITRARAAHGRCNRNFLVGRKYSDEPGCGCTALGKYKTGASYIGRFGLAYKLYGLDSTNRNAYRRSVVLHGHECIPPNDQRVLEICQSDGCPMVSPVFMQQLHTLIRNSRKPVLLWIYKSV